MHSYMENVIARTALLEQSRPRKRVPLDESCLENFLLPVSMSWWSLEGPQCTCGWGFLGWLFSFLASPEWEPEVLGCPSEEWVCRVLGPCRPKGKTEWQVCWGVELTYTLCKTYGITLNTRKNGELRASLLSPK